MGYSLVELSVVIAIISITLGGALDLATSKTISDKITDNEQKMQYIVHALENFLIQNQRLPCPANLDTAENDTEFGKEQFTTPSGIRECDSSLYNSVYPNVYGGALPVRTLNIDNEYGFDGWNRRFLYVVYKDFTINQTDDVNCSTNGTGCFAYSKIDTSLGQSSIIIKDGGDNNLMTDAVFLLISLGSDGYGAYTRAGNKLEVPSNLSQNDLQNAKPHDSGGTNDFSNVFTEKTANDDFDDIVYKVNKEQLLTNAGAIIDDSNLVCNSAMEVINNPTSNSVCQDANDISICTALANKIYKLCLNFPY